MWNTDQATPSIFGGKITSTTKPRWKKETVQPICCLALLAHLPLAKLVHLLGLAQLPLHHQKRS